MPVSLGTNSGNDPQCPEQNQTPLASHKSTPTSVDRERNSDSQLNNQNAPCKAKISPGHDRLPTTSAVIPFSQNFHSNNTATPSSLRTFSCSLPTAVSNSVTNVACNSLHENPVVMFTGQTITGLPNLSLVKQMHTVRKTLPRDVVSVLGPLSCDEVEQGIAKWSEVLKSTPIKILKPLAKEMIYHTRNGKAKSISVHGTKDKIAERFLTYAFKYLEQKNVRASSSEHVICGTSDSDEQRPQFVSERNKGAIVLGCVEENLLHQEMRNEKRVSGEKSQRMGSEARLMRYLEAEKARTNINYIGKLSANELCRAMHALCEPESMSAATKVFQDSSRLELDACCSDGIKSVDSGWLYVASVYNRGEYEPVNIRDFDVELQHINPSRTEVPRGPDSLKAAISALRTEYHEAERRFSRSGNNDAEFFSYCNGNSVLVYCYHQLKQAPHIRAAFPRNLPRNAGISTGGDAPLRVRPRRENRDSDDEEHSLIQHSRKRKNTKNSEIGTALRQHTESLLTLKQEHFAKATELKEKDLELRSREFEVRAERIKIKKQMEAGELLRSLNAYAKDIGDQITEIEIMLCDEHLSETKRNRLQARLGILENSYDHVNGLIQGSLTNHSLQE